MPAAAADAPQRGVRVDDAGLLDVDPRGAKLCGERVGMRVAAVGEVVDDRGP
jgi:hypothetical protein